MSLKDIAFNYPAIDNHAHPLCKPENFSAIPFEITISEAQGSALTEDAIHTLACYRAIRQLADLYGLDKSATLEDVKSAREAIPYDELCDMSMNKTGIQCLLLDDGLGEAAGIGQDVAWHNRFTKSPTKRIVRVEVVAQVRNGFCCFSDLEIDILSK
jgi:hypothetical protein